MIATRPLSLDDDLDLLHGWVTHERSHFWGLQGASPDDVRREYAAIARDPWHQARIGLVDGRPAFLVELYDATRSEIGPLPEVRPGDRGMHVLVAPTDHPVRGFTRRVFAAVMDLCFSDASVARVVVEPDVRNAAIRALNREAGFEELREVPLDGPPAKVAALSVCTRAAWEARRMHPTHLTPTHLEATQRHLVAKAIGELTHERVLDPVPCTSGWAVEAPSGERWEFRASRHAMDHWVVDPASLPADVDAQRFMTAFAPVLGIPSSLLPTYLEEIAATLASSMWKREHSTATSEDLLSADYQGIESAMTEGHPAFIANNGRIGFGLTDHASYAPECGPRVRLGWLAARRTTAHLSLGEGATEEGVYADVAHLLIDAGLSADDYLMIPVHPWQWRQKLAITFAPELARRDLVWLGEGDTDYQPQQSIRTFFDLDHPERPYVKTAISVQNMGFMRGLSPRYMEATPAINDWVAEVVSKDDELQSCGFTVLREVAAVGFTGDAYHALTERSAYQKMIAGLWRESPVPSLGDGERLATMASLLHRDSGGCAHVATLVAASGLDADAWVRRYLTAYLRPLVHALLAHDLVFMPHGENLVMVLRDHVPVRMIMKDIGEEVAVLSADRALPEEVERIRTVVPPETGALAIHTDVMDGFLRFLAGILDDEGLLTDEEFWAIAVDVLEQHAADHPELADAVRRYDLRRETFRHSCLNRLQLRNTLEMVDLADPAESLIYAGEMPNPLAR